MIKMSNTNFKITPDFPSVLVGYLRKSKSTGVHDDLYANLMLIKGESSFTLLIQMDLAVIDEGLSNKIKQMISDKYNELKPDDINIFSIHTHSGPGEFALDAKKMLGFDDTLKADEETIVKYTNSIIDKILESTGRLFDSLEEVSTKYSCGTIDGFYSNRNDKNKPTDKNYMMLKFYDSKNKLKSMIFNISCHPTILGPDNLLVSADLIGELRKEFIGKYGVNPLFMNGACGNISTRMYRQGTDFGEVERVGRGIFAQIQNNDNEGCFSLDSKRVIKTTYNVHYKPDKEILLKRKAQMEDLIRQRGKADPVRDKVPLSEIAIINSKLQSKEKFFDVNTKIEMYDDVCIVYFPGELDSNLGLKIKRMSPCKITIICCYANGYNSYFVAKDEYGTTFESYVSNTPYGETEKIVDNIIDRINDK